MKRFMMQRFFQSTATRTRYGCGILWILEHLYRNIWAISRVIRGKRERKQEEGEEGGEDCLASKGTDKDAMRATVCIGPIAECLASYVLGQFDDPVPLVECE